MYENEIIKKENIILSFLSFFDRISTAPWAKLYKADIIKRFNIFFLLHDQNKLILHYISFVHSKIFLYTLYLHNHLYQQM